jgi:hypothetical protein
VAKLTGLDEPTRAPWAIPVILTVAAIAVGAWRVTRDARPDVETPEVAPAFTSAPDDRPPPARCVEAPGAPFIVGEPGARKPRPSDTDAGVDPAEEGDDPTLPFAVEVGRGAAFDGGFAVGVRRDAETGAAAMVAILGPEGAGGTLIPLGRSRGDLDPPIVAGAGSAVLALGVQPNASGRTLKVARILGGEVTWGPELSEGRDDSLAAGIAASGPRAVVVWDDVTGAGASARSSVMLSSFDVATMRSVSPPRAVSPKESDASGPHVTSRPGGYWLAWIARGTDDARKRRTGQKVDDGDENEDQGEAILASWIEIVPLDEGGAPVGSPRALTPKAGHVVSFDLAIADNGSALVAWRDDDGPTGAGGGKVSAILVRLGGGGEAHILAEHGGTGAPDLLPGWISLASVSGPTRIAALSPSGGLLDDLAPEPTLGAGEPVAASGSAILWARPAGRAMRLSVVRCARREPSADAGSDAAAAGDAPDADR